MVFTRAKTAALALAAQASPTQTRPNATSSTSTSSDNASSVPSAFEAIRAAFPGKKTGTGLFSPASSLTSLPDSDDRDMDDTLSDCSSLTSLGDSDSEDSDMPLVTPKKEKHVAVAAPATDSVEAEMAEYLPANPARIYTREGGYIRLQWTDVDAQGSAAAARQRRAEAADGRGGMVALHSEWKVAEQRRDDTVYGFSDSASEWSDDEEMSEVETTAGSSRERSRERWPGDFEREDTEPC